ncbi:hypothetical protein DYB37_001537 [Aphanomyces astaci]|uniref:RBR-type E3 ubiquitin transferase n=1 Tax=Aphanomyces astaci TaxID=112090 RepID=A0A397A737_APHAT|nr:hypothetical protein DYB25_002180 [Aphanomyces astaci]RHY53787.1 hypothetical protein DYB38_006474 [Aphanomyces astaci]RHY57286.1 hypothetical protein DYB30_005170 [Aphanomyces astaci]RHY90578.1 hypothetical protein DYB35_006940 [Aphanomyces astaci]RHZ20311.1 hypothetical protein DYB31_001632 [Aphanomyces astaci]
MPPSSTQTSCCSICLEPCRTFTWVHKLLRAFHRRIGESEAWSLVTCHHVCCHKCIGLWIEELARSRRFDQLTCPWANCQEAIELAHVRELELSATARSFVEQAHRWRLGTGVSCPQCRYINPLTETNATLLQPATKLVCTSCKTAMCTACANQWHPRQTCRESQGVRTLSATDVLFVHLAKVKWNYQPCPHCGIFTERRSGCASMTCRFCWKTWVWKSRR